MKKLIFWDLDGTLIDTLEDLGAAVNHALGLRGLPLLGPEDFRKMVGRGVRNLVARALVESEARASAAAEQAEDTASLAPASDVRDDAYIDSALADFKEYYCAHIDTFTRPYPGMPELLAELSAAGVKMAVVSNKFQEGTERLVKEFFTGANFVALLGNRPGWPLKPSPEIVEDVLKLLSGGGSTAESGTATSAGNTVHSTVAISKAEAILVGDSPTDMRTATNGGIDAIAVTWGYSSPEELAAILATDAPVGTRTAASVAQLRRLLVE